jgi:hypothetical protein
MKSEAFLLKRMGLAVADLPIVLGEERKKKGL